MARLGKNIKNLAIGNLSLIGVAAICLLAAVAVPLELRHLFRRQQDVARGVDHSLEVINATSAVEIDLATLTGDARAYFVDRSEPAAAGFEAVAARLSRDLDVLRRTTLDSPSQQGRVHQLADAASERIAALRGRIIELRALPPVAAGQGVPGGSANPPANVPFGGRSLLERVAGAIEAIKSSERDTLVQAERSADRAEAESLVFTAVSEWLAVGGIFGGFALVLGLQRARDARHLAEMRLSNADLELRVRERTRELVEANARQKTYVECLVDGLVAIRVHPDGHFSYEEVNAAARRMLEFPEGCIGRAVEDVWPPDRASVANANFSHCVETRRAIRGNLTSQTSAGPLELRYILAPVMEPLDALGPDPRIVMLLASLRDVTYELRLETELSEGQRVAVVGQLAAGVAHDLNNLLQAQMGSLELLEDAVATGNVAAARGFVDTALRLGDRVARMTNHLLSFSRKQLLRPCAVGIAEFLSKTVEGLASSLGPAIELSVSVDLDAGSAMADPALLETALLNLALNARDAMPKGGRLRIEAFRATTDEPGAARSAAMPQGGVKTALLDLVFNTRDAVPERDPPESGATPGRATSPTSADGWITSLKPGRYVVIAVVDDGAGMTPKTLSRAMEPFFTTKGVKGSGLGLAMVQSFILRSKGDMRIISEVGHGTRIEIWLPACAASLPELGVDQPARRHPGRRALIVDDVADVLVTVGAFLEHAGYAVTKASSGEAALALLQSNTAFDILISDFAMPGISGADLIDRARALHPTMPVLLITGNVERVMARELDRVTVLGKPFRREGLLRAVSEALSSEAGNAEAQARP